MSLCDFTLISIELCFGSRYFLWFERGEAPFKSCNFELANKPGLNVYFWCVQEVRFLRHVNGLFCSIKISSSQLIQLLSSQSRVNNAAPFSFYHYFTNYSSSWGHTTLLLIYSFHLPTLSTCDALSTAMWAETRVVWFWAIALPSCLALTS